MSLNFPPVLTSAEARIVEEECEEEARRIRARSPRRSGTLIDSTEAEKAEVKSDGIHGGVRATAPHAHFAETGKWDEDSPQRYASFGGHHMFGASEADGRLERALIERLGESIAKRLSE